ncbi:unnamed protein product (macronuclear) [Paramecium tetraurelia]|uniref:C3H1-type domain-containing protein n=1 Tax=Paramecium tetraurelia TaxID=5888 RepID=A0CIX8_PARTE|nr:uncharacterized protein GSPATT00007880001 [Paramecium tetraurelia]CAK70745.1 unnamed protein product [Paramecium tetraurelia]|eukprot:XP_001438142.1 hypothetical protein (macronuclear) [Paramecium tetraurelia strain d4-2]
MNLFYPTSTIKQNQYESSTLDTDTSDNENNNFEIDVKPQKKHFETIQEKQQYIEEYTKKKKTELCKNFVMTGRCKYGDKCSFAHGQTELQPKTHLHSKYKTKPCKRFFQQGYCPYGIRCQYIHDELINQNEFDGFLQSSYKELGMKAPISSKLLKSDVRNDIQRFILTMNKKHIDQELFIYPKSRLSFFKQITNPCYNILSDDSQKSNA